MKRPALTGGTGIALPPLFQAFAFRNRRHRIRSLSLRRTSGADGSLRRTGLQPKQSRPK